MKKMLALALAACMLLTCVSAMAEDVIKIGIFEPMTGQTAAGGAMEKEGFDLANELFPTVLGKKVELVYGDNKSDRAEATLAAQSLVDKGVVAVLGSYTSGLTMAGGEVFGENEIPALTVSATNPMVTLDCEWYARVCFIDPFQGTMLARYAAECGYKKIAIMCEKDSEYAVGLTKYFQDEMKLHPEIEIMDPVYFMNKDEDFSALLGTVIPAKPDAIFTPVSLGDKAAQIYKQARALGYAGDFFGGDTLDVPELFSIAGEAAVGAVFSTFYDAAQPATEMTSVFVDAYRAKFGKEPTANGVMAFDGYLTMLNAIERAGTTEPEALRDALFATEGFVGAAGVITLDENHDAVRPVVFKSVQADGTTAFVTIVEP
ncbi:MAG: ABC transporter substrate-binding protein [bacterium]|nr:ABC transporter substrate-binding protein [bacterium]